MKEKGDEHKDWYAYAEDDLKFARVGLREGFYAQVCFHAQQTAEKVLKGFLLFRGKAYPKTHSLTDLVTLIDEDWLTKHIKSLQLLDEFYVPIRYPDAAAGMKPGGPPNERDAREALSWAEEIFQEVLKNSSDPKSVIDP